MNRIAWFKNKKKVIMGTVLGFVLFLSTVIMFSFTKKLNVDSENYIADVKAALQSLNADDYAGNADGTSVVYNYLKQLESAGDSAEVTLTAGTYQIYNVYDWMALSVLSYNSNLEGFSFVVQPSSTGYDLTSVTFTNENGDSTVIGFQGLALNEANPFKGTISTTVSTGTLVQLNTPLFGYLDASAGINKGTEYALSLNVTNANAGLASVLVGSGEVTSDTLKNITLSGTVLNQNGYAGAVFGEIKGTDADNPLVVSSLGITNKIDSVSGLCAGGVIGHINGNVQISVGSSVLNSAATITYIEGAVIDGINKCVGGVIGDVSSSEAGNPVITFTDSISITNPVKTVDGASTVVPKLAGGSYTGGLIGKAEGSTININGALTIGTEDSVLDVSCKDCDTTGSGGVIGTLINSTVTASSDLITINISGTAYYMGGFVGDICDCNDDNSVVIPDLSVNIASGTGSYLGGFAGKSQASDVTITALNLTNINFLGSPGYTGGVLGEDTESSYAIGGITCADGSLNMTSDANICFMGGFGGKLIGTALDTPGGMTVNNATITAMGTAPVNDMNICVGGIIGSYTNTKTTDVTLSNYTIDTLTIYSTAKDNYAYVGGVIGAIEESTKNGKVNVSDCSVKSIWTYPNVDPSNYNSGSVNNEGAYKTYTGGIVGGNFAEGTSISNVSSQITTQWKNVYCFGGVVAVAAADCSVDNATDMINTTYIGSNANYMKINGGIVGEIKDAITVDVSNVTFADGRLSHRWNTGVRSGGIAGKTGVGSVLCLGGMLDLSLVLPASDFDMSHYYGSIVGEQNNSLLYMNPISYSAETGYTYGYSISENGLADEVGNYGSVYRNGYWDTTDKAEPATDVTDTGLWVIKKDSTGAVTINADPDNNPYLLNSVGDAMRLSIALNSEDAFTSFDESTASCDMLLKGAYTLDTSIDLSNTGIQTLNKNAVNTSTRTVDEQYRFTGSITGSSADNIPVITNTFSVVNQGYLGLFSAIGSGASFENIGINSTILYYYNVNNNPHSTGDTDKDTCDSELLRKAQHFGGITAYAEGNISINNVKLDVTLDEYRVLHNWSIAGFNRYFGGAIGHYKVLESGNSLTINKAVANTNMTISEINHYAGGLVGYIDNSVEGGSVSIEETTVGGIFNTIYRSAGPATEEDENVDDPAKMGGVIATIGADSVALEDAVDPTLDVTISNLTIKGVQMQDELVANRGNALDVGGLIGYKWKNVDVEATGITVDSSDTITSGITVDNHSLGASYGGLWNTVGGHMKLSDVLINSMAINVPGSAQAYSNGLLVGNGQYLYLELEEYKIEPLGVSINDTGKLYFDEIVGYNKGTAEDSTRNYYGVVSIITEAGSDYQLYNNQIIEQNNPNTRYFYNLATDLAEIINDENEYLDSNTVQIDSVAKMLQWSLGHHVNKPLRQFFNIDKGYSRYGENVTFAGEIDLGDASYYPVTISGGTYVGEEGSKITFNGKSFDNTVNAWKSTEGNTSDRLLYTYNQSSEHYSLQSGLFYQATVTAIDNITLSGSVTSIYSYSHMYSGALICSGIYGIEEEVQPEDSAYVSYVKTPTTITNITLDNVSVSHVRNGAFAEETDDGWHDYYGLMIGAIGNGSVVQIGLDGSSSGSTTADGSTGARMINYDSYTSADEKVATALIGQVGYERAQGIDLSFYNMKIADVDDNVTSADVVGRDSLNGTQVMAHASYIYSYNYTLDNTTNIYIFYLQEYKDQNVTLGEEIGTTVQFYDADLLKPISEYTTTLDTSDELLDFDAANYKPYVYTTDKLISVNPKNGDITEGCGTYDDPYIIDKSTQLMSLYYYLKDYETYADSLKGWEINAFGDDTITSGVPQVEDCSGKHEKKYYNVGEKLNANDEVIDELSTHDSLIADGFPTVEQLNNAYYMITADLDLSKESDFTGFGTDTLPFTGVFVGSKADSSGNITRPVILMAATDDEIGATQYGFIKIAKGAVVRNLQFNLGVDNVYVSQTGTASGVIATIVGGDNLIDSVKVNGEITSLASDGASYSIVGGYVGELQKGALILRGYEDAALSEFVIDRQGSAASDGAGAYQNGMVGKVLDGYVADDDSAVDISAKYKAFPATTTTTDGATNNLKATDVLNTADADNSLSLSDSITDCIAQLDSSDKISVTQTIADGYQYQLDSAQDLLVVSFAINSGTMNYAGDCYLANVYLGNTPTSLSAEKSTSVYGYDIYSRCRNADYSYVGMVSTDEAKAAYLNAIRYDNCNVYTEDGASTTYTGIEHTYDATFYHPYIYQYFDFSSDTYILWEFSSYTGFSAASWMNRYGIYYNSETDNNKSFNSTYNLAAGEYDLSAEAIKKCFVGIGAKENYASGYNTVINSFQGSFVGAGSDSTTIKMDLDFSKFQNAALFNLIHRGTNSSDSDNIIKSEISGFTLSGNVTNTHNVGNVIAAGITSTVWGWYDFVDVKLDNLNCDSTVNHTTGTDPYNRAAGFIVRADYTTSAQNNEINFTDCSINNSTIKALDECAGYVAINEYNGKGNNFAGCSITDSTIQTERGNIGGYVGSTKYPVSFDGCHLKSSVITRKNSNDGVWNTVTQGVGGFVGYIGDYTSNDVADFSGCTISCESGKTMGVYVEVYDARKRYKHVGGFVGTAELSVGKLEFNNCDVSDLYMQQRSADSHVGSFIGFTHKHFTINAEEGAASELTNIKIERSFFGSTAGVVGVVAVSNKDEVNLINNLNLTGLSCIHGFEASSVIGGIVANHTSGMLEITNTQVTGTEAMPVALGYHPQKISYSTDDDGNQVNPNLKLYTGGIVGKSVGTITYTNPNLVLKNCSFGSSDNEEHAKIINSRYAGGMVGGYHNKNALLIEDTNVSNAVIQAIYPYTGTEGAPHGAAGGVVGIIDNNNTTVVSGAEINDTTVSNLNMVHYDLTLSNATTETEISNLANTQNKTIAFGGIVGLQQKNITITDFNLSGLNIGSDGYAGEAGGAIGLGISCEIVIASSDDAKINTVKDSIVVGGVAGGVIGNTQRTPEAKNSNCIIDLSNVLVENTTVLAKTLYGKSWEIAAGGVTGRQQLTDSNSSTGTTAPDNPVTHKYKNVTVRNSVVSAFRYKDKTSNTNKYGKTYMGGFIGMQCSCETKAYDVSLENVLIGALEYKNQAESVSIIPTYADVSAGNVTLYDLYIGYDSTSSSPQYFEQHAITAEKIPSKYISAGVGTFVGKIKLLDDSYISKAQVSYDTGLEMFHPSIDVGVDWDTACSITAMDDDTKAMAEAYKNYMGNFHILYKEQYTSTPTTVNHELIADELSVTDYPFAQMDAICDTKFTGGIVDSTYDYRLDFNYMQTNSDGTVNYLVKDVLDASYESSNGYLSPYEWDGEKIPMLVSAGQYDINTVINTAINVLTNNGGATNGIYNIGSLIEKTVDDTTTLEPLMSVEISRKQFVMDETAGTCTIQDYAGDDVTDVLLYDDSTGVFSINGENYDSVDDMTFNLITVKYLHDTDCEYVLHIPVFVRDTLKITTHMKGVEGSSYSKANITGSNSEPVEKYSQVIVDLNSSYTIYTEFIYSSAREEYTDLKVSKSLYRTNQNESEVAPFAKNTKITLLDLNNNLVYFYAVDDPTKYDGTIPFEAFTELDGTVYEYQNIADTDKYSIWEEYRDICNLNGDVHTKVGLEEFLIIIDESEVENAVSGIYDVYVRADEDGANADIFKNAVSTAPCHVRVNEIPGLYKFLSGSNDYTTYEATGKIDNLISRSATLISEGSQISREGTLGLQGSAYIISPIRIDSTLTDYWPLAEYRSSPQYLEFAISLEMAGVANSRVKIPDGTMVTVTINGNTYGTVYTSNAEYIYCYYDTLKQKDESSYFNVNDLRSDTVLDFDVQFDFSTVTDFSGIMDAYYNVKVELLDTPDYKYPRNGDVCDTVTIGTVEGINKRTLGFALETDENELLTLGMNAYNSETSDKGRIAFKSSLDFSDYMDVNGDGLTQLKAYNGKYFTYTFVLERKNKVTEASTGAIQLEYDTFDYEKDGTTYSYTDANKYIYPVKILDGQTVEELADVPSSKDADTENLVILQKTEQYFVDVDSTTDDAVSADNTITTTNQIMEEEYTLFADVEELIKTPENITNYKVTCYVTISDTAPTEVIDIASLSDEDKKAEDFFIFTVAKLKTDMD